ncbi:antitoxin [Cellulomonas hominis]|uniref:antitoxin n=1 Tax=Cellulomonas hominis TaxID=156981 RepID=UPI001BA2DF53|nr:antitoxin [Cellulomonas hominis]VTR77489.1 hypothetical protein CHMI_02258 [Cellulomonas hominis]
MGIGDFVDKAKRAVAGREDQIAGAIDKAAGVAKTRTSASTDRKIDQASSKARDFLEKQKRAGGSGHPPTGPADPTGPTHPNGPSAR